MSKSIFNPTNQHNDVPGKIAAGLERISGAFKVLLWEKATQQGLSPIQIQVLIFTAYHKSEFCNVSHLAKEFNITKPTVSDAVRVLEKKGLIKKDFSSLDNRSYSIFLSQKGKDIVSETEDFADPIKKQLQKIDQIGLDNLFETISKLIYQLNLNGIITIQRTCFSCNFYQQSKDSHYCNLLEKPLLNTDIRLDCPEYEENLN